MSAAPQRQNTVTTHLTRTELRFYDTENDYAIVKTYIVLDYFVLFNVLKSKLTLTLHWLDNCELQKLLLLPTQL